jgi:hypothetical protein
MSAKREVKLVERKGVWFVVYVTRAKYTRYNAAQFDTRYSTLDEVKEWIAKNGLDLVEPR